MTPIRPLLLAVAAIALAAVACSGAPGGSGSPSPTPSASTLATSTPVAAGIVGRATAGPVCPVEKNPPDPSCAPRSVAGAVIVIRDASGAEVARATTGADGTYAVAVSPGRYVVEALPVTGLMGTPAPQADITVAAGAPTTVDFDYDTGIR